VTDTDAKPPLDFPELESGGPGTPADEFAGVPSPRRRHPAIALGAVVLAGFLLYQIHEDVFYAISHSDAHDIGDARAVAALPVDKLPVNQYVRMSGMADRESGVIIDTAGSWQFTQFFRLLGTKSRIFVSRVPDPIPVEQAERDVFVGRLIRFQDLSFQAAIRKHFANRVGATHFFAPAAVSEKLAAAPGAGIVLPDLMGESVGLSGSDDIAVDVSRPADVKVEMPRAKWADAVAARAALEPLGAKVLDETVTASDGKSLALVVTFAEPDRDRAMSAIADLDPKIRLQPVRRTYDVRLGDLAAVPAGLRIKTAEGEKEFPLARIVAIRTVANVQIPPDALLLREGERPRDHLKVLIAGAFLLGFALINLLSLRSRG
jgi:hypothetical protein